MNSNIYQFQLKENLWILGSPEIYTPALDIEFLRPLRELKEEKDIDAIMVSGQNSYRAVETFSNARNLSFRREGKLFVPENRRHYQEVYDRLAEKTVHLLTGYTKERILEILE
jgi:hypothetical protein